MNDADGFRTEAAVQFGFKWTNDDADEYACTEAQLIAFAKACERKGRAEVAATLRTAETSMDARAMLPTTDDATAVLLATMSGVVAEIANQIDADIAATDAELAPILETERQSRLAEQNRSAVTRRKVVRLRDPCEHCGATSDEDCKRTFCKSVRTA